MELSIAIGIIVLVIFVYLYQKKKRKEQQMGNELENLIDAGDWQGVCRILMKQLILWGAALLVIILVLVFSFFYEDKFRYSSLVVLVPVAWRFILLVRLYYLSRHNAKVLQIIDENTAFNEELIAEAEALLIDHAIICPSRVSNGDGYFADRLSQFDGQFAPYGLARSRYKGMVIHDKSMSMDEFNTAYAEWEKERLANTK